MKPFARLRGIMREKDIDGSALANYLGRSVSYVSSRMTGRVSWDLDDIYRTLEYLGLPEESIFAYFPPNGGIPQERSRSA